MVSKYVDPEFPPNSTCLAKNFKNLNYTMRKNWKSFQFRSLTDIFPQRLTVFDSINPSDILQGYDGALGDCYFLSAISALAEFPARVQNCFITKEMQPSGRYTVAFYDMGMKTSFTIDDYFPCNRSGNPVFCGPKIESSLVECWTLLLEKAWAKRFGSYWAIDAGYPGDSLRDLTGAPCELVLMDDPLLWEKVFNADQKDYIIVAGSPASEEDQERYANAGLMMQHAYSIIKVQELHTPKGLVRVLHIRNPYGDLEWNGPWSDKSTLWSKELKAQVGLSDQTDGTFWMSIEDFKQFYMSVVICRAHDNYHIEGIHSQQIEGFSVFEINLMGGGDTYFIVTLPDSRKFDSSYQYASMRIIVAKEHGPQYSRILGVSTDSERDLWVEDEALEPGRYFVYVEISWKSQDTDVFGFSVYSAAPARITEVTGKHKNFLEKCYNVDFIKTVGKKTELAPEINFFEADFSGIDNRTGKNLEGITAEVTVNTSKTSTIDLTVTHETFVNTLMLGTFKNSHNYNYTVKPGESKSILKTRVDFVSDSSSPPIINKQVKANKP